MNLLGVLPHPDPGPWAIGPLDIHAFGLSLAVGLLISVFLAGRRGNRILGVPDERVHNLAILLVIVGWIFSHIFAVVTYEPHAVLDNPLILFEVWGMISSVGGILGGIGGFLFWCSRNPEEDHLAWANLATWMLPIAFFFGRVGCTFAFDHPGKVAAEFGLWNWFHETTGMGPEIFPLAMEYFDGQIRHNMGFYEALVWFVIMVAFLIVGRKPRRRGLFLWVLPIVYGLPRFFLDFLRAYPEELTHGDARYLGLTPAQYTSLVFVGLGIWLWIRLRNAPVEEWASNSDTDGADSN